MHPQPIRGHQPYPNSSSQSVSNKTGLQSSSPKSPATSTPLVIPGNLSFIAKVEEIRPNQVYANRSSDHPQGFFLPPNRRDGYETKEAHIFRYQNNVFQAVPTNAVTQGLETYRSATVFSQATSTDHLLTVPFDSRKKHVTSHIHDWRSISFNHKRRNNTGTLTYGSLAFIGGEEHLPAPVPEGWKRLIPRPYRFSACNSDGNPIQPTTNFGGLIGELPLLIALTAFSSIPNALSTTLVNHTRGGKWQSHAYNTGLVPERGLVVTVYLDPANPAGSTKTRLDALQNGGYGPFLDI